eukprot:1403864-Pyramimonas_sp.AAC.1
MLCCVDNELSYEGHGHSYGSNQMYYRTQPPRYESHLPSHGGRKLSSEDRKLSREVPTPATS